MKTLTVKFKTYFLLVFIFTVISEVNAVQFNILRASGQFQNLQVHLSFSTIIPNGLFNFDTTLLMNSSAPIVFSKNIPANFNSYVSVDFIDCDNMTRSINGYYFNAEGQATVFIDYCIDYYCFSNFNNILNSQDTSLKSFQFFAEHTYDHSRFVWNFGNGDTLINDQHTINYTFPNYGIYNVCLSVYDSIYNCLGQFCKPIKIVSPGAICEPRLSVSIPTFGSSLWFEIVNGSIYSPTAQYWLFLDGNDSTAIGINGKVLKNYSTPGIYTAGLKMINTSCEETYFLNILAGDTSISGCKAEFGFSGQINQDSTVSVFFYNTSRNTQIFTKYHWDFGDGNIDTLDRMVHDYALPGVYDVSLIVSDSTCIDTFTVQINTSNLGIECDALFSIYSQSAYNMMIVNNAVGNNLSYFWEFGDGYTSTDQFPTHNYQENGSYLLQLTVEDTVNYCRSVYWTDVTITSLSGRSNQMTLQVVSPNAVLSTNEPDTKGNHVKLFPNPAKDNFRVEFDSNENARLMISDYSGKLMKDIQVNSGNLVEINEMPAGIYFISIQTKSGITREKLVKQ